MHQQDMFAPEIARRLLASSEHALRLCDGFRVRRWVRFVANARRDLRRLQGGGVMYDLDTRGPREYRCNPNTSALEGWYLEWLRDHLHDYVSEGLTVSEAEATEYLRGVMDYPEEQLESQWDLTDHDDAIDLAVEAFYANKRCTLHEDCRAHEGVAAACFARWGAPTEKSDAARK